MNVTHETTKTQMKHD